MIPLLLSLARALIVCYHVCMITTKLNKNANMNKFLNISNNKKSNKRAFFRIRSFFLILFVMVNVFAVLPAAGAPVFDRIPAGSTSAYAWIPADSTSAFAWLPAAGTPVFAWIPGNSTGIIAYADPGDGDGSGNGQNKDIPLTLRESVPSDEELNVPLDVTIELYFNKNICNVKVLENNKKCFHLTSEDGEVIPLTITVPDDQVQRTYKRDAFLKPKEPLEPNTRYRVAVDKTLMAKNGRNIDNAHVFEFVTGTETGAPEPEELKTLGGLSIQTFDSALPETEDSVPVSQDELLDGEDEGISTHTIAIIAVCIILAVITVSAVFAVRRRRQ